MLSESEMAPDFCEVPRKLSLVVPVAMCVCVCVLTRFLLSIYAIYLSSATIRAAPSESEKNDIHTFFFPIAICVLVPIKAVSLFCWGLLQRTL